MEKKFIIIMTTIILLLTVTLGVLIFSVFGTDFNFGTNRDTHENLAGDPARDTVAQDAEEDPQRQTQNTLYQMMQDAIRHANSMRFDDSTGSFSLNFATLYITRDYTRIIFVHSEEEFLAGEFPNYAVVAWPSVTTHFFVEGINKWISENAGKIDVGVYSLGFPLTVDDVVTNWKNVQVFWENNIDSQVFAPWRHASQAFSDVLQEELVILREALEIAGIDVYDHDDDLFSFSVLDMIGSQGRRTFFGLYERLDENTQRQLAEKIPVFAAEYRSEIRNIEWRANINMDTPENITEGMEDDGVVQYTATFPDHLFEFGGIAWRILDVRDDKMLIISEFTLENRVYHREEIYITWADSDIRRWLNQEFYNRFTDEERARISETLLINNDNPWFAGRGGQDTIDKIFLLSIEEVLYYFSGRNQIPRQGRSGEARFRIFCEYYEGFTTTRLNGDFSWWWLRSPGVNDAFATLVVEYGVSVSGAPVDSRMFGVRPAMWIYL